LRIADISTCLHFCFFLLILVWAKEAIFGKNAEINDGARSASPSAAASRAFQETRAPGILQYSKRRVKVDRDKHAENVPAN
jgi:hypothetical protein